MDRRILKWFLFLCFVIFFAALIFIFAMPKDIEAKRDISSFPEAEIEDFNSVKDLQEVSINYKNEDKIINIGKKIELPLLSLLCSVESVGLKKNQSGGRITCYGQDRNVWCFSSYSYYSFSCWLNSDLWFFKTLGLGSVKNLCFF